MDLKSGRTEQLPYSLSRWTDVPADLSKWSWWLKSLAARHFVGFDPRTACPSAWSLDPDQTLGLIWWTKNPARLLEQAALLRPYHMTLHMTLTAWEEAEPSAPRTPLALDLIERAVQTWGPDQVTWRFSPVPLVERMVDRFDRLAARISATGIRSVAVSFLQPNDRLPETRDLDQQVDLLTQMAGRSHGLEVRVCAENPAARHIPAVPHLTLGICEPGLKFGVGGIPKEGCGCCLAVDPFTINEACQVGCRYCYAADRTLAAGKRNTTRQLPMVMS